MFGPPHPAAAGGKIKVVAFLNDGRRVTRDKRFDGIMGPIDHVIRNPEHAARWKKIPFPLEADYGGVGHLPEISVNVINPAPFTLILLGTSWSRLDVGY